jgi:uncharacterized phage protein gp47/JayE
MPFTRPTLKQIIARIEGDFKSGLGLQTILRRSFLAVKAKAYGGASHTAHGHIQYGIEEKFFPDTGDEATVIRWGTLYNLPRKEATFAEIVIEVTGTTGNTLPEDRVYVRSDGVEYFVKADTVIPAAGTALATIVCQTEGETGNLDVADTISLQSALAGVESDAVVDSITVEGEDEEDLELYRERVLDRLQFPPSGGTVTDFISYALSVAGVTRAWVLPNFLGAGTVGVTFVEDAEDPIIPDSSKIAEVQAVLLENEPQGTAGSTAFAPVVTEINPTIQLKPNTAAVQAAVQAELEDLLAREAQVRDAVDPAKVGSGVIYDGKIKLSQINEAISIADGEDDHILTSPTSDVQPQSGGLVTLGTITFVTLP